jgi:hypothetical protein
MATISRLDAHGVPVTAYGRPLETQAVVHDRRPAPFPARPWARSRGTEGALPGALGRRGAAGEPARISVMPL